MYKRQLPEAVSGQERRSFRCCTGCLQEYSVLLPSEYAVVAALMYNSGAVSYTHLDVYKRQTVFRTDGGRDRIRLGFADEACSVVIHNILKDTGTGIVAGDEEHSV